ncbi:hypothetical protein [Paractinoplanes durhamensis]|nr:hypothetical protein [Actinoplanes durhamensis]
MLELRCWHPQRDAVAALREMVSGIAERSHQAASPPLSAGLTGRRSR